MQSIESRASSTGMINHVMCMEEDSSEEIFFLEGLPIRAVSYRVGAEFVAEAEVLEESSVSARGIGMTEEASLKRAVDALARRLERTRSLALTVGG